MLPEDQGVNHPAFFGQEIEQATGEKDLADLPHAQHDDGAMYGLDLAGAEIQGGIRHPQALGGDRLVARHQVDNALDFHLVHRPFEIEQQRADDGRNRGDGIQPFHSFANQLSKRGRHGRPCCTSASYRQWGRFNMRPKFGEEGSRGSSGASRPSGLPSATTINGGCLAELLRGGGEHDDINPPVLGSALGGLVARHRVILRVPGGGEASGGEVVIG